MAVWFLIIVWFIMVVWFSVAAVASLNNSVRDVASLVSFDSLVSHASFLS